MGGWFINNTQIKEHRRHATSHLHIDQRIIPRATQTRAVTNKEERNKEATELKQIQIKNSHFKQKIIYDVLFWPLKMKQIPVISWSLPVISSSLCLWFPHASKNPSLCPYQRKTKSHAWMTGGPLLWPPSSASVLRSWSETTSALCCLLHWTHYNLHTAVTVPQTMLLPSPCTLLSPTWKIRTPMWGCCSWIIVRHLTP